MACPEARDTHHVTQVSCQEQTGNDGTGYTVGTGVATAQNYKWANNSVRKVQWDKKSEVEHILQSKDRNRHCFQLIFISSGSQARGSQIEHFWMGFPGQAEEAGDMTTLLALKINPR